VPAPSPLSAAPWESFRIWSRRSSAWPRFLVGGEPSHRLRDMLELGGVFMLVTLVVFVGYGVAAAWVRQHVVSRPRVLAWMRRTFAAAFLGLGLKLALAERS
jgi:threonine/homoserine/homoserine lactone efflux protein